MAVLRVELLGGFRVSTDPGHEIRIASRKAQALMACLALRPGASLSRDHLASLLWDESDAELARASLRQALAVLRRSLPADGDVLLADSSSLSLDPARVASDVACFRELVRDGSPSALAAGAERYAGEFLQGLDVRSAAFEAWVDEQRRSLRQELLKALGRAAVLCRAAADLEGAAGALLRLVALEPANEAAQRELIELLARLGRHTEALRQYRTCVEALRRDLDVAPEPATEALYRQVLRKRRAAVAVDAEQTADRDDREAATAGAPAVAASPPPAVVASLREVVVLVARIAGASPAARDDPEAVRDQWLRAEVQLREVVSALGGEADRPSQGEATALFGLTALTGNEADRAVRAALRLVAQRADAPDLRWSIGVARGLVLPSGADRPFPIAGQPVAVAQALARSAATDTVLVTSEIAAQLGDRYGLAPAEPGAPGDARVVLAERPVRSGPARGTIRLAGRRAELALLDTLLERVGPSRRGRMVIVRGDPGIGKSSLLEALAGAARARNHAVHVVQILDFGQALAERPAPALNAQLLGLRADADESARRGAIAAAVDAGLLPREDAALAEDLLALSPSPRAAPLLAAMDLGVRQQGRLRVFRRLLERAAQRSPLLVIVEDAHWADPLEVGQIGDMAGTIATLPVLLAVSTRAEGDPFTAAWRTRARGCPVTTLDLAPLAEDEARELAAAYRDLPAEVLERCLGTAAGHPLFLVQLLRSAQAGHTALPGSVRALLLARVECLPAATQGLLQAAAALGPRFSLEALQHVLARPVEAEEIHESNGLLSVEGDECSFTHALVRAAIYESLLRSTRRALHQRAATWFEARDATLYAEHLDAAEDPAAAAAHLRAANVARSGYRLDRAEAHAGRACALAQEPGDRCDASAELGDIRIARGRTGEAIADYRDSVTLAGTPGRRARARLGLATALRIADRYDEALAVLEQAERDASDEGDPRRLARVWTLRGNLHFPRGEMDQCLRSHERALELAQEACSPEDIARALGGLADAQYQRGRMLSALEHLARCIELCERHGLLGLRLANQPMVAVALSYVGRFVPAVEAASQVVTAARQVGDLRAELLAQSIRGSIEVSRRQFDVAVECSHRSTALAREIGAPRFVAEGMLLQGLARMGRGELAEAVATLEDAVALARESAPGYCAPWALAALACACGDAERGRELLAEGERHLERGAVSHNHLEFRMYAIEFHLDLGDWSEAERNAGALEGYTAAEPLPWADLVVARGRALAAAGASSPDEALRGRLEAVLQRAEQMGFEAMTPRLRRALAVGASSPMRSRTSVRASRRTRHGR